MCVCVCVCVCVCASVCVCLCDLPSKINFATKKLISKGTLRLLYTNIDQPMNHATVVYVAVYHAVMLPILVAYCRK